MPTCLLYVWNLLQETHFKEKYHLPPMKFVCTLAIMASLAIGAFAACDNGCSGHGTCSYGDVCTCYQNWRQGDEDGGDCSDRQCPYEVAWVDKPDKSGLVHKWAECAGRGICDRTTGECQCFDGYTGKGCQRTTCPNDCSGHGTCEFIEELPYGTVYDDASWNVYNDGIGDQPVTFGLNQYWDKHKTMGCKCDPTWTDVDCSRRMCPKGTDVLQTRYCDFTADPLTQVQKIHLLSGQNVTGRLYLHNLPISTINSFTFALQFTSTLNETYVTRPIKMPTPSSLANTGTAYSSTAYGSVSLTLGKQIELALEELPHQVIDDVDVTTDITAYNQFVKDTTYAVADDLYNITIAVTFSGSNVQGPQHLLSVVDYACGAGCTPKLDGLPLRSFFDVSYVMETRASTNNNYECGRRGKCDYETGLCQCFDGYTGPTCGTQTALV